jgi:regulator of replication initiation timing
MYKNTTTTTEKLIKKAQDLQIASLRQQVSQLINTVETLQQENVLLRQQIDKSSLMGKKSSSRSKSRSNVKRNY